MKTKRKYEAKTGEEWLQHASRYLHTYKYNGEWLDDNARQAQRIIAALITKVGDEEKA